MIAKWEDRLAAMDHSRGTSNKMRMDCMKAEIKELREAVRRADHKLETARGKVLFWRKLAYAHRAELAKVQKAQQRAARR